LAIIASNEWPSGEIRQMNVPGLTAATGAGAAAAAPPLQLSSEEMTFFYQASGLS